MKPLKPAFACVTPGADAKLSSCHPCSPDEVRDGSQCYPCNPCSPDQITNGSQCYPCNPCSPDQMTNGSQCYPCNPCSPDQMTNGSQCYPCNPCSPDQMSGGNSGGGSGCFISSACVESLGLPDDCDELQTLRVFRDRRKAGDPAFAALVDEYYAIAPGIVERIARRADRKRIYEEIYAELVQPCVRLIKENREDEAIVLYTAYVKKLHSAYAENDA